VAAKYPDKLAELKQLWFMQASKYSVLPLDASGVERLARPRPQMSGPRDKYVYYPGTGEVGAANAADVRNRSFTITAFVDIPKAGAEGVLLAHGGSFGGYSFFVKDGKLTYSHNYLGIDEYRVVSDGKVPAGKVELQVKFERTGKPDFKEGKGAPGTATLFINGKQVGEGKIPVTVPLAYGLAGDGLCCGKDTGTAVSSLYNGSEFPFTGVIQRVVVDLGRDQHPTAAVKQRDD
jgi:arylsulfatase